MAAAPIAPDPGDRSPSSVDEARLEARWWLLVALALVLLALVLRGT